MKLRLLSKTTLSLLLLPLSGCVAYGGPWIEPGNHHHGAYEAQSYSIPPGHLPPPGECRIWYPDRPPGHQPPPGNCYDLERRVPPDAILVRG